MNQFFETVQSTPGAIPAQLKQAFQGLIQLSSEVILLKRNDAGHPELPTIARAELYPQFAAFPGYCKACFDLMKHWDKQPRV